MVVVSNGLCGRVLGVEGESVVDGYGGNLLYQEEHMLGAILEIVRRQVYVTRRSPRVQRGKQDSSFQHESVRMRRARQAVEKAFEGVELDQLVRRSPGLFRFPLEVEVPSASLCLFGRPNHSTISRA